MPREKKAILVKTVKDPRLGMTVDIFYDPNAGRNYHTAKIGSETFTDPAIEVVERWAYTTMRAICELSWIPVIKVECTKGAGLSSDRRRTEKLDVDVERFYVAQKQDGKYIRCEWETSENHRILWSSSFPWKEGDLSLPYREDVDFYNRHSSITYIPYTDQMWMSLNVIADTIRNAREQLQELLQPDNLSRLECMGQRILSLPERIDEE